MPVTDYERAKLRLQAFALLDGWGLVNETGRHVPHNFENRKKLADQFVEWALENRESVDDAG